MASYYPCIGAVLGPIVWDVLLFDEVDRVGAFHNAWDALGQSSTLFAKGVAPYLLVLWASDEMAIF